MSEQEYQSFKSSMSEQEDQLLDISNDGDLETKLLFVTYPANKQAKEEVAFVELNRSLEQSLQHLDVHCPVEKQLLGCFDGRERLRAVALHGLLLLRLPTIRSKLDRP
ncbi:hypothetical protein TNCV_3110501 [Trichonephila clavipes]|nr:hypothetical protein TNCV_3110501 [Trichonephila clavipes]